MSDLSPAHSATDRVKLRDARVFATNKPIPPDVSSGGVLRLVQIEGVEIGEGGETEGLANCFVEEEGEIG